MILRLFESRKAFYGSCVDFSGVQPLRKFRKKRSAVCLLPDPEVNLENTVEQ